MSLEKLTVSCVVNIGRGTKHVSKNQPKGARGRIVNDNKMAKHQATKEKSSNKPLTCKNK
jgi:hypothetical protein